MLRKQMAFILILSAFVFLFTLCSNHSNPTLVQTGRVEGVVQKALTSGNVPVANAYVFWGDSLMAETDANGAYEISDLPSGDQTLLCSALYALDNSVQVEIGADKTTTLDFVLTPDSTLGRVNGEFQDIPLYQEQLAENAELASWTAKEMYDATTGATLQNKFLSGIGFEVPRSVVTFQGDTLGFDDGYGQFWFKIQQGTYPFVGSNARYESQTRTIKVVPDEKAYLIFFLNRK